MWWFSRPHGARLPIGESNSEPDFISHGLRSKKHLPVPGQFCTGRWEIIDRSVNNMQSISKVSSQLVYLTALLLLHIISRYLYSLTYNYATHVVTSPMIVPPHLGQLIKGTVCSEYYNVLMDHGLIHIFLINVGCFTWYWFGNFNIAKHTHAYY